MIWIQKSAEKVKKIKYLMVYAREQFKFYVSNIYYNLWIRYANSNCSENKEHLKLTSVDKGAELSVIFLAGYNYPRKFLKKIDIN